MNLSELRPIRQTQGWVRKNTRKILRGPLPSRGSGPSAGWKFVHPLLALLLPPEFRRPLPPPSKSGRGHFRNIPPCSAAWKRCNMAL